MVLNPFNIKVAGAAMAAGGAAAAASIPVVTGLLSQLGFTSGGVALGSTAASVQTATTASGSVFAVLQTLGATGAASLTPAVPIAAGILGAASVIAAASLL